MCVCNCCNPTTNPHVINPFCHLYRQWVIHFADCRLCAMIVNVLSCSQSAVMALHCRLAAHLTSGKHIYELRQRCGSYLHFIADLLPELIMSSLQRCQLHLTETISSVIINTVAWIQQQHSRYNSQECCIS